MYWKVVTVARRNSRQEDYSGRLPEELVCWMLVDYSNERGIIYSMVSQPILEATMCLQHYVSSKGSYPHLEALVEGNPHRCTAKWEGSLMPIVWDFSWFPEYIYIPNCSNIRNLRWMGQLYMGIYYSMPEFRWKWRACHRFQRMCK